ncbi:hypothetical protein D1872_281040 [compost metagenome]
MVQVVGNFSHERIGRLKEIVRHLRPVASHIPSGSGRSSSRSVGADNGNYPFRERSSNSLRSSPPSPRQQQWIGKQNKRLRTTRVTTGAIAGGVVGGTATAIAGGSFVAGAAAGAVIIGAVVWAATNRR